MKACLSRPLICLPAGARAVAALALAACLAVGLPACGGSQAAPESTFVLLDGSTKSIADFKGASLPYFTTHHELVRMQREALDAKRKAWVGLAKDDEWSGDGFVAEAESMVSNS